jgi:hypothetical protein
MLLLLLLLIVFALPYSFSLASIQYHELPAIENMTVRVNRFTPELVLLDPSQCDWLTRATTES